MPFKDPEKMKEYQKAYRSSHSNVEYQKQYHKVYRQDPENKQKAVERVRKYRLKRNPILYTPKDNQLPTREDLQ